MLAFSIATGLALASSPLRGAAPLHRGPALSMSYNGGGGFRGDNGFRGDRYRDRRGGYRGDGYGDGRGGGYRGGYDDEFRGGPTLGEERLESVKACAITGVVGTAVASPILIQTLAKGGNAELQLGLLFVTTFLFGAVYRCAVRSDDNAQLKLGAVAAFAVVRALATVSASASAWTSAIQANLWGQLWIGAAAFGHAAIAYELALDGGAAFPLEGRSRALDRDRYYDGGRGYEDDGYGVYDEYRDGDRGRYDRGSYGTQGDFYGNSRGGSLREMAGSGLSRYNYEENARNRSRPPL